MDPSCSELEFLDFSNASEEEIKEIQEIICTGRGNCDKVAENDELEFFDFSNASEEEIKEVQEILRLSSSNGFVELPWEIPLVEECRAATPVAEQDRSEVEITPESHQKTISSVVGQGLLYNLPHAPSVTSAPIVPPQPIAAPLQNPDLLPVDAYVPPPSGVQLPAVTTIGHYPNAPYVFSRTYPYMRAYPHLGVPLFTCLPGSNEIRDMNPMQPTYGQFVPLAAAVPQMDKHAEMKDADIRAKNRGPIDRQFNRRNKKKHLPNNSYCNPELGSAATDSYQESVVTDDQMSQTLHQGPVDIGDNLPSVTSSVPLVPLPVPPSTFAVTSGAIPMHGYPPGLHTLPYSQMSGPQTPSTPVYYVPVFNHHPYAGYLPSPSSGPMILPMGVSNIHPVSDSNSVLEEQIASSNDIVAATDTSASTGVSGTTLLEHEAVKPAVSSPGVVSNTKVTADEPSGEADRTQSLVDAEEKESVKIARENTENANTLCEAMSKVTLKDNCIQGRSKVDEQREMYEGSRCWADLFKKQCSELNGLDRQSCASDSESSNGHTLNKDISNGKLYSVPGSEDIL